MFGWFKKVTPKGPEEIIGAIEAAGIRFKSDAARTAVLREVQDEVKSGANIAEAVVCAMGDEQMDDETFEQKPWLSDDVWHFDYEAIEDHGAYKAIVENCVRISGTALKISGVTDYVDVEEGKAWVEFSHRGARTKLDLKVDNDWADPRLFAMLNDILESDGSPRRLAQHDLGQDCLIVCRNASEIADINKLAGLKFRQIEG